MRDMKRVGLLFVCLLFASTFMVYAQEDVPAYKRNYVNKSDNFVERARTKMEDAVDNLTTSDNGKEEGTVKISGAYYMHLYRVNLFHGEGSEAMRAECSALFAAKYPTYKLISVALPQTDWMEEAVVKDKTTVGYVRFMCCYILAFDGDSGYINARFIYKDYKDAGKAYVRLSEYSPKWDRSDFLSQDVYEKLLKK